MKERENIKLTKEEQQISDYLQKAEPLGDADLVEYLTNMAKEYVANASEKI